MDSPLVHVSILGALLLAGLAIRTHVPLIRKYFIPTSLIAGLLGMSLGRYGLNIIPEAALQTFSLLPEALIAVVFAPMLMGLKFPTSKDIGSLVIPHLLFGYLGACLLISVPLILTALVLAPVWGVNPMFGTLAEVGFTGGHGTAAGMTRVFSDLGWEEGGALGLTTATIGLFVGIVCGMILINTGVKRGQTSFLRTTSQASLKDHNDVIPQEARRAGAMLTLNRDAIAPLAFHFSLICGAVLIGATAVFAIKETTGLTVPLFPMAMIGGLVVQLIVSKTRYRSAVDPGTFSLIQGFALEFLIVSAVTVIAVPVVLSNAIPLVLFSVVSFAVLISHFYIFGPRLFKNHWFEHSIINYGSLSAVAAIGLMLLRTVDPDNESEAAKGYALRAPFISPIVGGGLLTAILPLLVTTYGALIIGLAFFALFIVLVIAARMSGFWHKPEN